MRHRSFTLLLIGSLGTFASYALLLPVVPMWAATGGASPAGAGATTGVFMLTTVLTQMAMPWLLERYGHRGMLGWGSALMGVLSLLFTLSSQVWLLIAVSALRGVGFGMVTVTGSALIAVLLRAREHGRGSALYGLAVGVPNVAGLPAGVWIAENIGHRQVFVAAGALALAGTLAAVVMPAGRSAERRGGAAAHAAQARRGGPVAALPRPGLFLPAMPLAVTALAAGAVVTFLSAAVDDPNIASAALFAFGLAGIVGRSMAGFVADRLRRPATLLPGLLAAAVGTALLAVAAGPSPAAFVTLTGAGLLGGGFGAVQNDVLIIMFRHSGPGGSGTASTVWNVAYDGGFGIGAIAIGAIAAAADFTVAYAVAAAFALAGLPAAVRHHGSRRAAARPGTSAADRGADEPE